MLWILKSCQIAKIWNFVHDFSLFPASQQDLQAILDFDDLFAFLSIEDQSRLTVLAHPSGTSSGWLKA